MGRYLDFSGYFELIDRIKRATSGDAWLFALSHKEVQDEIIRLNTINQLYEEGIRSDGSPLGPYQPFTIQVNKIPFGLPYDHVTLYQTGEFYASFYVSYDSNSFTVHANGQKSDKNLFDVYGDDVLGLTVFNVQRIRQLITRYYAEYTAKLYNVG